jgi:hypothetical protein
MIEDTPQVRVRFAWNGISGTNWRDVSFGGIYSSVIFTEIIHVRHFAKGI